MKLLRFTKDDWYGWAGCSDFSDGTPPYIAEEEDFILIIDGEGITLFGDKIDPITGMLNIIGTIDFKF